MTEIKSEQKKSEDFSVMLAVLTFIILNATFLAYRNDDALTPIFFMLSLVLTIGSGYYIYNKRFKST